MAQGNSRAITTNQTGVHEKLIDLVSKYLHTVNHRPINSHTQEAFDDVQEWLGEWDGDLILDNCCGVGASTVKIAQQHPHAKVIGIDKSAQRVDKHSHYAVTQDNYMLVRADLNDFWRLARQAQWQCVKQYMLYPNPYPKSTQVQKRWHGSPAFLDMLALGGELILRSNWRLYLEEVAVVLAHLGQAAQLNDVADDEPMTPFEAKYQNSGQVCWELRTISD
jgi:tRNA G46 methylase TrmB